ncbi:MAG: O-antigen ligase family protein [Fusobacterium sp.]|uniref:O-antigen ligase family protein n=1 Tax=Fusobacterium sp. TaxID=68766 RepID=UPI003995B63F
MKNKMTIGKDQFYSGIVILLALFSTQSYQLFGVAEGNFYKILFFSKYIGTVGLTLYVLSVEKKISKSEIKNILKIFYPLILLMIVAEIVTIFKSPILDMYGIRYWTRAVFIFFDRIFIYILAIDILALFGQTSIDYLTNMFLIDELIIFISGFFRIGFLGIIKSFMGIFAFDDASANYFEVHELTFSIGLLLIYYLFFEKNKKERKNRISLLIFCFILGAKRIGIAGIIIAGLFSILLYKKELTKFRVILLGVIGTLISFIYLFILYDEKFFSLLNHYGINNMGRDLIYSYFIKRTKFSLFQSGWGIAGVAKAIENMDKSEVLYMVVVRGLHNDILKIYINFGFFMSLMWYIFNLVYIPLQFFKKYGERVSKLYFSLITYMFITYLTDNTEGYFTCQVTLVIIPLAFYLKNKKIK